MFDRRGPQLCRDVDERLTPVLIDRDPLAITGTLREMERQLPDGQMAIAGVEMALWDIAGKALGAPVYVLLGGKMRERIPLSYSVPHGQPEQMAEFALARKHEAADVLNVYVTESGGHPERNTYFHIGRTGGGRLYDRHRRKFTWGSPRRISISTATRAARSTTRVM